MRPVRAKHESSCPQRLEELEKIVLLAHSYQMVEEGHKLLISRSWAPARLRSSCQIIVPSYIQGKLLEPILLVSRCLLCTCNSYGMIRA